MAFLQSLPAHVHARGGSVGALRDWVVNANLPPVQHCKDIFEYKKGDLSGIEKKTCVSQWVPCSRCIIDRFEGKKSKASRLSKMLVKYYAIVIRYLAAFTWPDFPSRTTLHFSRGPNLPNSFSKSLHEFNFHPRVFLTSVFLGGRVKQWRMVMNLSFTWWTSTCHNLLTWTCET